MGRVKVFSPETPHVASQVVWGHGSDAFKTFFPQGYKIGPQFNTALGKLKPIDFNKIKHAWVCVGLCGSFSRNKWKQKFSECWIPQLRYYADVINSTKWIYPAWCPFCVVPKGTNYLAQRSLLLWERRRSQSPLLAVPLLSPLLKRPCFW